MNPANATSSRTEHVHSLVTRPEFAQAASPSFPLLPRSARACSIAFGPKGQWRNPKTAIKLQTGETTRTRETSRKGIPFVDLWSPQSPPPSLPRRKREIHGERIKGETPRTTLEAVLNSRPRDYRDMVGRAQTWSQYMRTRHDSNAEKARVYLTGPCRAVIGGNQNGPFTGQSACSRAQQKVYISTSSASEARRVHVACACACASSLRLGCRDYSPSIPVFLSDLFF